MLKLLAKFLPVIMHEVFDYLTEKRKQKLIEKSLKKKD